MKAESDDEWELSKENIQPIQQGRKQNVLKVALAPHPDDLNSQQRRAFEHELRTYSGPDILSVWFEYIKWVEQNFPKGGREGHIKQLIERCLVILKNEKKYYDDERFIDIMLKFANISEKPSEVFDYMYTHNIGCKLAKFFITWSWELEQLGSLKRADQVLTEGIQRQAQPFDKIKAYRKEFDMRLACKVKEGTENSNFEVNSGRSAFAMLKPQKSKLAPVSRTGEAVIDNKDPLLLGRQKQPNPAKISISSKVPFKIYNSENVAPPLPVQTASVATNSILHSEKSKENEQKPSKWNKVKVKSHCPSFRPSGEVNPSFKFHCDDEVAQDDCTPRSVPKTSNILSTRCKTSSPVMALFEPPDPLKKPMYPKNKVYGGAEEYSLEEIRAADWFEKKKIRERELFLEEQERQIKQKAREKEELEKEIHHLTKKMHCLKSNLVAAVPKFGIDHSIPNVSHSVVEIKGESNIHRAGNDKQLGSEPEKNFSLQKQTPVLLNNDYKDTSENVFPFSQHSNKLTSMTDSFYSKTDSTSYHEASKMVQDLYNKTLSQPVDNFEGRTNTDLNSVMKCSVLSGMPNIASLQHIRDQAAESNKLANELPFELYHDPTVTLPSSNNIRISLETSTSLSQSNHPNSLQSKLVKDKEVENNDLPFSFYQDATEDVHQPAHVDVQTNILVCNSEDSKDPQRYVLKETENFSEDSENIPPEGYVQEKCQRELAGILEPSKNILFVPLEEQEDLQDDIDLEVDVFRPCKQNINETLIPPSNTEQFSTALFTASTPCASRHIDKKTHIVDSQSKSKIPISLSQNNISEENNPISTFIYTPQPIPLKEDVKASNIDPCLPKMLSAIMETSSENYSKSSTSSNTSASFTKSGHLDPNHFPSVRKPRLDTLSSIVEVPDSTLHLSPNKIVATENQDVTDVQDIELYVADFDPFDSEETLNHLKSVDFSKYTNLHNVNRPLRIKVGEILDTGKMNYRIECLIAQGAYAKVYQGITLYSSNSDLNFNEKIALKVCKKSNEWEFFVCSEIHKRLAKLDYLPDVKNSLMNITSAVKFSDSIVLVNGYGGKGTLLDVINYYKKKNHPMPETIAMYLTFEILHIVSTLHKVNVIHGDIKPDNFLIMNTGFAEDAIKHLSYSTTTLQLIDFGRAIDLNQYKKGICFTTSLNSAHFKCVEMRENKPWVFQLDWYGVLCCIHALIFSEYMSIRKKNNKWAIEKKFKRYSYISLWEPLFADLLNIPVSYEEPNIKKFTDMIETRLQKNSHNFILELQRISNSCFQNMER